MTKAGERLIRAANQASECVGYDWLRPFREEFPDEFYEPEDEMARRAIERGVAADRKQISRPVREA